MISLPLNDSKQWPLRMTRQEVAYVLRKSVSTLRQRIVEGRFPKADGDGTWARSVVENYVHGQVRELEKAAHRRALVTPMRRPA